MFEEANLRYKFPSPEGDETYEEWIARQEKAEKYDSIRDKKRAKKKAKARAKRKRTGR